MSSDKYRVTTSFDRRAEKDEFKCCCEVRTDYHRLNVSK